MNFKKRIVIIVLIAIVSMDVMGQSFFYTNLYTENKYSINPAYAGLNNDPLLFISYRKIASSIGGVPETLGVGLSSAIYKDMSLGGRFYKQSEGLFKTVIGFVDYSYKLKLNREQSLRFGISAGLNSNKIDYSEIIADDPAAIIDVASKKFEGVYFESAAGLVYNWNKLELSVSVPKIFDTKNKFLLSLNSLAQYTFNLEAKNIDLRPSILVSYKKNSPILYDVNIQAFWRQNFWLGIGYRNRPGIVLSAGLSFDKFSISYASEIGTERYANMFNQTHEIGISYSFAKKRKVPNDTLFTDPVDLLAEKDSVTFDKPLIIKPLTVDNISHAETDVSFTEETSNLEYENSEEVYLIKPLSSNDFNKNNEDVAATKLINLVNDSSHTANEVDFIENEEESDGYELVEIGDGIFTLKKKSGETDSGGIEPELTEEMLDSLILESELFEQSEEIAKTETDLTEYYSIQLFIDESNKDLLTNAEVVDKARIESYKDGAVEYYYGYFETQEEAEEFQNKLNTFGLKTELFKFYSDY